MKSFSIQSFGCRVNQAEAFLWTDELQHLGLTYLQDFFNSDLVLVNTCTLTARADRDVRTFIRRVNRENPHARLIVTGCFAERAAEELRNYPNVWKVFSNREKETLAERIRREIGSGEGEESRPYRSRPLVKIQDGCDFGCTFCVIPSVRGKSRSFDREEILERVRILIGRGFREIILTGIHLCLYGRESGGEDSLRNLLHDVTALPGLGRVRLSSLDPRFMNDELLEDLVSNSRICPHFHLSLQHGSDRIIALMGRKISTRDYVGILRFLSEKSPWSALGTDVIVGFPGETDEDFLEMESFLQESPLTYFHVFPYSPRSGTPAAEWKPVPGKQKKERSVRLRELAVRKNLDFRLAHIGKTREGIVIERGKRGIRILTDNYIEVDVPQCRAPDGALVRVEIMEVDSKRTKGMIVEDRA